MQEFVNQLINKFEEKIKITEFGLIDDYESGVLEGYYEAKDIIETLTKEYKPKTYGDKIRTMNDEELANFLMRVNLAYAEPCMTGQEDCKYAKEDSSCTKCFLEYLKKDVE